MHSGNTVITRNAALICSCSSCSQHGLCSLAKLSEQDTDRVNQIITHRRRVERNKILFDIGDDLHSLYIVRIGYFKTNRLNNLGFEQITGFQTQGELLGLDAISTEQHMCRAIALEDSEVCELPFDQLQPLLAEIPTLLRNFHRLMSQEILREQRLIKLLGTMKANQRFAAFLVNQSSLQEQNGYSATAFMLRMSREDIGNHLGLTIESVSRQLSRFKECGLINFNKREIEILNLSSIKAMIL